MGSPALDPKATEQSLNSAPEMPRRKRAGSRPPEVPPPAIVVDGDVSPTKLDSLIEFALDQRSEQDELEFKLKLDLSKKGSRKEKLELVADVTAMAAGLGGYIVVGLGEDQVQSGRELKIEGLLPEYQRHFDISNLRQLVEEYTDVRIDIRVGLVNSERQPGKRFGLICVMSASEFPIVMSKDGVYRQASRESFAFKDGDILVRRSGSTVRARQADVRQIVSRVRRVERARWVEELSETGIDKLVETLSELVRTGQRPRPKKLPSAKLILGPEEDFETRLLDMLSDSGHE